MAKWFYDKEVYDFIWQNLPMVTKPNMRMYGLLSQLRRADTKTWKTKGVEILVGSEKKKKVYDILTDSKYKTPVERIAAFQRLNLGKKSLYYELVAEFKWITDVPTGPPPALKLTKPPKPEEEKAD